MQPPKTFIEGLDELIAGLKDLAPNIERESLRTGVFRAAQFLRDQVKAEAPVSSGTPPKGGRFAEYPPGTLKKSIKAKRRRGNRMEAAAGITGAFYAKWVEFGHALKSHGATKASRQVIGHVPPNPFVRRAFEANKEQVVDVVKKGVLEAIEKKVARMRAKMPKP